MFTFTQIHCHSTFSTKGRRLAGVHLAWIAMAGILVVCGCAHTGPKQPSEASSGPEKEAAKRSGETGAHLSEWIGRYPSDTLGDPPRRFLDTPVVRNTLKHMLPSAHYQLIRSTLRLETPITCIDGFLVVSLLEPHNAPGRNAVLLFGLKDEGVMVVVYEATSGWSDKRCTTCYSTGILIGDLSDDLKEAILEMHIPLMHENDKLLPQNKWINDVCTRVIPPWDIR